MRGTAFYRIALALGVAFVVILASALALQLGPRTTPEELPPAPRLTLSVATDHASYEAGEMVNLTVRIENAGSARAFLEFGSSCPATYRVEDGPSVVYDWSTHRACLAVVTNLSLDPGASASYAFAWDQTTDAGNPVPAGREYRVVARMTSSSPVLDLVASAAFFVEPAPEGLTLGFSARTDRPYYSAGDGANVSVTLTNLGVTTVTLHFPIPCYMEFLVYSDGRGPVYNSTRHWGCIQILAQVTLAPGASTTHTFTWNLSADDGMPLPATRWYTIVPQFAWADLGYQQYVTRTEPATFYLAP